MSALPLRQIPVINLVYAARKVVNPKLTLDFIATKCGVSGPLVSMWFTGKRSPNEKQAVILARLLACELDLIWAKADSMEEAMQMAIGIEHRQEPPVDPVLKLGQRMPLIPTPGVEAPVAGSVPGGQPDYRDGVVVPQDAPRRRRRRKSR